MLTLRDFAAQHGLRCLGSLGSSEEKLALCETEDGELRVLRRYAQTDAPCQRLLQTRTAQLAAVYACFEVDGETLSLEEYIDGTCLSALLRQRLFSARQTAAVARELCRALQTLHSLGLVHRDVKPENVLLTRGGRVVLLDLDAAAPLAGRLETNTTLLGTAGYAAPEQFGFSRCDVRADIFALGVLMNVMLTGEHPSSLVAKGPLGKIIRRCIQTEKSRRYPDIAALAAQLPAAKNAERCTRCGAVSPGGGCIWCGEAPGKRRAAQKRLAGFLLAALMALGAAGYLASQARRANAPSAEAETEIEMEAEAAEEATPSPASARVQLAEPVPLSISGAFQKEDRPYLVPFTYDLDGDGAAEEYYLAVAEIFSGATDILCPPHGSRRVDPGEHFSEYYAPVICRAAEDGAFEQIPALAGLIEDAQLAVYYLGDAPQALLAAYALPEAQNGLWHGAIRVDVSSENLGDWYYHCRAKLGGEAVEAGLLVTYRENNR